MTALLHVERLGKSAPGPRRLFAGPDLAVRAGEADALISESEIGKSNLLNILTGLDDADEGTVAIMKAPPERHVVVSRFQIASRFALHGS